jgi:4-hydroxythreonine-4-phosphate dehydrogenase
MGDPSGIGPSIIAGAISEVKGLADFVVIGDRWVMNQISAVKYPNWQKIKFIDLDNVSHKDFSFGKIRAAYGKASMEYLDKAMDLIKNYAIDCLVTCPISKEAIGLAGFNYPGHTEYLAKRTSTKNFVMMLLNKDFRISLVTRHIPLKEVPGQISQEKICQTISLSYKYLKEVFRIKNPRLVTCGLNPHASDNGLIGDEENKIIKPALQKLKSKLRYLDGPLPADVAILKAKKKQYDCIIAIYHDQALIPLKLSSSQSGVNMTLGLPFIRTSPLHGTAFDIAGTNKANPASLIEAIKLAVRCASNLKKA